ncbi:alpha/beta fold hydrolase [Nitrosovibrio tenuis]|uniref:Pimeloyl-ACP methyl ester carboxylesterase n=1 Tax=Nitrosovibrio tenuis TaxID=1233 RepID=A0A1H7PZ01_9PROT|nr:alpha/beta hydrolase [Nitrosovibrio tenuis]SEL40806.1 Pimeloyl-ACP methyl ester carboxylesterase [Nitrosovibrio tenuis]
MELISSSDGTSIACWHSGAGEPLLLVHGTSGDHLAWAPVLPALERHFSVWTIDRRGRGRSGDANSYAFERECEDIARVVDGIGGSVHLLGHSFGGLCALEAALLTPNIGGLILYEPSISLAGSAWSAELNATMQYLLKAGNREEVLLLFFRDIVKTPSQEIAAMQGGPSWHGRIAAVHTIPRELQGIDRYIFEPARFHALQIFTMLLLGGDSPPRRHRIAEKLHQALPFSQIKLLQGQQHSAMRTAPDLFVREVTEFLSNL